MKTNIQFNKLNIDLLNPADGDRVLCLCNALNSSLRLNIYRQLIEHAMSISEVARVNEITVSSASFHTAILEKAGLIEIKLIPNKKGKIKVCHAVLNEISLKGTDVNASENRNVLSFEMPVGMYTDANLEFVSGYCTDSEQILFNDGNVFVADRRNAQLLWCASGHVEYTFPALFGEKRRIQEISFSLEICSETINYRNDWKSDISFSLNGTELITFTSPGDFGGRRGVNNPSWWPNNSTQYGQLKTVTINSNGIYLDGVLKNGLININSLNVGDEKKLLFRVENKPDSFYKGGFNIFGKGFGDYNQDIVMTVILE